MSVFLHPKEIFSYIPNVPVLSPENKNVQFSNSSFAGYLNCTLALFFKSPSAHSNSYLLLSWLALQAWYQDLRNSQTSIKETK